MSEQSTDKPDDRVAAEQSTEVQNLVTDTAADEPSGEQVAGQSRGFLSGLVPKLAIMIAVIAVMIAAALWWQYRQFYVELSGDDSFLLDGLEDTRATVRRLEDEIQALRGELAVSETAVGALSDDVEALPVELRALGRRVEALQGGRLDARDSWLRQQAEYYLVLANVELGLGRRIGNAIAALELADDVLRDLGDPGLVDVRGAVAAELQNLRAVPQPDLEGLAANLGGLISRVPDLPMRPATPADFGAPEESLDDVEPGLGRLLERTRGAVTSIVRIERQEEPVGLVLTESERRLIRHQLALELQIARTAVLERRQEVFRASLVAADEILNRDFNRADQSIVETRALLGEMMRAELSPELPAIGDSLTLLRNAPGGE
jgi:uroporphyrin-III C-methyltransferase